MRRLCVLTNDEMVCKRLVFGAAQGCPPAPSMAAQLAPAHSAGRPTGWEHKTLSAHGAIVKRV